jgi:hypothetical protein
MKTLPAGSYDAFATELARTFSASGRPIPGHYLYDNVSNPPPWFRPARMTVATFVDRFRMHANHALVFFDRQPNNHKLAREVLLHFGLAADGPLQDLEVELGKLSDVLSFDYCDMYVTLPNGRLACIATYVDEGSKADRLVWANDLL